MKFNQIALTVFNLQSGYKIVFSYVTLEMQELWFLCMTHRLIVLYTCMKFHLNGFNGCQLTERTRNSIVNDQREITTKLSKALLWFLCITHCFIVFYNCAKFQPNSFNSV